MAAPPPYLYLAPGAKELLSFYPDNPPPIPEGATRVVSISDTHNEHDSLDLPWGHILVHAGDVLTESGQRYCSRNPFTKEVMSVDEKGPKLFRRFAKWLGQQPHPHKVIIGGNHDLVLQHHTPDVVRSILDEYSTPKTSIYLEHEEATVGGVTIFGSPFAHWGGRNDAYMSRESVFHPSPLSHPTHIVITHSPCILPKRSGVREDHEMIDAMVDANTLLCVGGHCHWAHGLYHSTKGNIPCVVASVCDSKWLHYKELRKGPSGKRGDTRDKQRGGYNLRFPIIVSDIMVPPPSKDDTFHLGHLSDPLRSSLSSLTRSGNDLPLDSPSPPPKPNLLFFGPSTDPKAVQRFIPKFAENFEIYHFDEAEEAVEEVEDKNVPFTVCVAKLGSKGNLGKDVMKALRDKFQNNIFIIVHSATAAKSEGVRKRLADFVGGVDLYVDHSNEEVMWEILQQISEKNKKKEE